MAWLMHIFGFVVIIMIHHAFNAELAQLVFNFSQAILSNTINGSEVLNANFVEIKGHGVAVSSIGRNPPLLVSSIIAVVRSQGFVLPTRRSDICKMAANRQIGKTIIWQEHNIHDNDT